MIRDYPALSLATNRRVDHPVPGDCQIRIQHDAGEFWLDVIHADPRILVADEALNTIERAQQTFGTATVNNLWITPPAHRPPCEGDACPHVPCWTDWLLHLDGRNRTVIYRIGRWVAELNCWEASWPD